MLFSQQTLARDGLHVSLSVSLGSVEIGSIALNIKGGQQGSEHRRHKKE